MPTFKSYVIGFILSVTLTLVAYFAVTNHASAAISIILGLAMVQLVVQLIFFLHLGKGKDARWNIVVFASTISIIVILVGGSIWIMHHLNYNMTPQDMNTYMLKSEGMPQ